MLNQRQNLKKEAPGAIAENKSAVLRQTPKGGRNNVNNQKEKPERLTLLRNRELSQKEADVAWPQSNLLAMLDRLYETVKTAKQRNGKHEQHAVQVHKPSQHPETAQAGNLAQKEDKTP